MGPKMKQLSSAVHAKNLHWAFLSCRQNGISIGPELLLSNRIAYGYLFNEERLLAS